MENAVKTALVYDWLVTVGGGEKTFDAIAQLYPSPIYTLVHDPSKMEGTSFANAEVHTSFLQKMPFAKKRYRNYLPFFPLAVEQFDLRGYDVVISTSHAVAKGALTQAGQLHLCYCFTPMRYAWDLTHRYLEGISGFQKAMAKCALHYLRNWDIASLNRVDQFAANSHYIARRIEKVYGRKAAVIYPPVDTHLIELKAEKEEFFVTASRMVPYKNIELIVEAFSHMPDQRLIVIGDGPEMPKVKKKAGKNVEILGYQSDPVLRDYLGRAKGFLFAAEEDFGIVVVEAQAAGTPVIALGKGGALETVIDGKTGVFFKEPTVEHLVDAVQRFKKIDFNPLLIRDHADKFSKERFQREFKLFVDHNIEAFYESHHPSRR
ncbi:MAG: glycosyltransferase [Parachlamydiales bacterium]|nr:glycosyltransferase [Candidatus Acheromyda pituitae]